MISTPPSRASPSGSAPSALRSSPEHLNPAFISTASTCRATVAPFPVPLSLSLAAAPSPSSPAGRHNPVPHGEDELLRADHVHFVTPPHRVPLPAITITDQACRRPGGSRTRAGTLGECRPIRWTTGRWSRVSESNRTLAVLRPAPHAGEIRDMSASAWTRTRQPSFGGTAVIPLPEAVNKLTILAIECAGMDLHQRYHEGDGFTSRCITTLPPTLGVITRDRTGTYRVTTWCANLYTMTTVPSRDRTPALAL